MMAEIYNNESNAHAHNMTEPNNSDFDQDKFDLIMGLWLPGIFCTLGMLGNALALLVLSRDRTGSVNFISLRALTTSDFLLLLGAMCQQVVPFMCTSSSNSGWFCRNQGYVRVYSWPIICIAQMCSIWMTVLISTERFIAICYPLNATRISSSTRMRAMVLGIYLVSILFNIPKFFEFTPVSNLSAQNVTFVIVGTTELRQNIVYRYLYNTGFHFIIIFAFPMITLTVLNTRIVREIKQAKKNWEFLQRKRKMELKATVLPLVIVLVYFVCGTQSLISFILDAIFVEYHLWLQIYTAVVNLLVIMNSAVNFILMYAFGAKFRKLLTQLFIPQHKNRAFNSRANFTPLSVRHSQYDGHSPLRNL